MPQPLPDWHRRYIEDLRSDGIKREFYTLEEFDKLTFIGNGVLAAAGEDTDDSADEGPTEEDSTVKSVKSAVKSVVWHESPEW